MSTINLTIAPGQVWTLTTDTTVLEPIKIRYIGLHHIIDGAQRAKEPLWRA